MALERQGTAPRWRPKDRPASRVAEQFGWRPLVIVLHELFGAGATVLWELWRTVEQHQVLHRHRGGALKDDLGGSDVVFTKDRRSAANG